MGVLILDAIIVAILLFYGVDIALTAKIASGILIMAAVLYVTTSIKRMSK